ncbi:MBL fold metallo-hydrolase [Cellulomonas sp. Sa3CUA2]|uniref:MBL fold metallo-hydrolase n=1 Tax=Cellulomonas avistercoris TaxID=2762242 RepID=A0ABR8QBI2_9CELL|nr:MBL fold metallo-hydrolase [Cellulomonas avistercoris]MBD7917755.1 MBL fold metallo-hydrolase [Cellulomonas avistercoris]
MRLLVLGCAGSFPGPGSAASSYLVQAEDADGRTWSALLDLGNGALGALQRWGDPAALDVVALSHLHADHVADMAVLGVYRRYHPGGALPRVAVHGPEGTRERLGHMSGDDLAAHTGEQFDVRVWRAGEQVVVGPLTLEAVPVDHPVPAFGIRVTGPSEGDPTRRVTLAYSGDTDASPGLEDLATAADLLLAEAAFVEGRDDHVRGIHLTGRRAGEAAARGGARSLVLTHVPAWNDPAVALAEARAVYDGPVTLASPGTTYPL